MKIDRESLAMVLGSFACILAGLNPSCEIPSAALSWINADDTLIIRSEECAPGLVARSFLLGFASLSLMLLIFGRHRVASIRHVAWFVLFLFMLIPAILTNVAPSIVKDSQIVYKHVDLVIADMEHSFNHQQVAWRDHQTFDQAVAAIRGSRSDSDPASLSIEALGWSSLHLVVDNILGYSNALLNLLGAGWYLAMVGLVCWIMGAYSGDPDAARRRGKDIFVVPIGAAAMLLVVLMPRIVTQFHTAEARKYSANGNYLAAVMHMERANASTPLREFALFPIVEKGKIVEQLLCDSCNEIILRRADYTLRSTVNFGSAIADLERVARNDPDLPGLRYWLSISHILNGFARLQVGQYSAADLDFSRALVLVPIDAMAWYGKSLVQTRVRNFDRAAKYLANALAIQQTLGFKRLTLQGQLHLMQSWSELQYGDLTAAHANYARYLNPESW